MQGISELVTSLLEAIAADRREATRTREDLAQRLNALEGRAPGTGEIAGAEDVTANQLFTLRIRDELFRRLAAVEASRGAAGEPRDRAGAGP